MSLVDTMSETNGSRALVTETWLKRDRTTDQFIQNMTDGFGYGCIRRDRLGVMEEEWPLSLIHI